MPDAQSFDPSLCPACPPASALPHVCVEEPGPFQAASAWPSGSQLHPMPVSLFFSPSQLPHNWLPSWGGDGDGGGEGSTPWPAPRPPYLAAAASRSGLCPAAPSSRTPRPATPRSSHAELGLLKMRAGSPSSRGSRCGFSDNSFNPSGASGTTARALSPSV